MGLPLPARLTAFWTWLTDDHVVFSEPGIDRVFARCTMCGRVFMHYWGCVTKEDRLKGRRVGCPCGGLKMRIAPVPFWQQAWFVLSRYVWKKLIRKDPYWDPRLALQRVEK